MLRRTERILENIPVGSLGLISLTGCEELGKKVDDYLVKWRHESGNAFRDDIAFSGYEKDSCLQLQPDIFYEWKHKSYVTR